MRKTLIATLITIIAIITVITVDTSGSTELSINTEPPHTAQTPLPETPGQPEYTFDIAGVEAEHQRQVDAYLAAVEAERLEAERVEAERVAAARQAANRPAPQPVAASVGTSSGYADCDGVDWIIPVQIVWRESRCNFHAVNHTGCGGFTCVGAYQFDLRHWIPRDQGGWGGCAWLGDWTIPQNQIECARQMSRNGTNLAPWGW